MTIKKQFLALERRADLHSWERLAGWLDSESEANQLMARHQANDTRSEFRILGRDYIFGEVDSFELEEFAISNQNVAARWLIGPGQFSCDGWYLEVNDDGRLTGNVVEANEPGFTCWADEALGCVCKA